MLTNEQIKKMSVKLQTADFNVAREYCQHIFLSLLYQLPQSEKLFFKGGTALRIVFASPRFSEDLDFSSRLSADILQKLLQSALRNMDNFGINTDLLEAKATSGGFLAIFVCQFLEFSVQLQMEVSKRKGSESAGEIYTIASDFLPSYTLMCLNTNQLIEEKIQAALSRQKPRDFFDIYFLLRSRLIAPKQKVKLPEIKNLFFKSQINFSRELKKFLPVSFHPIIKNFRQTLLAEINRNI